MRGVRIGLLIGLLACGSGSGAATAAALCPADPAGNPALRELCACPALAPDAQRLQCFDRLTRAETPEADGYQPVSFTDLAVDGDLLRHRKIRLAGFILLTPTSVYIGKSALEIATAVPVDIEDLPRPLKRVLYETCRQGCQGVFTGTLEGTTGHPQLKADNALPPS